MSTPSLVTKVASPPASSSVQAAQMTVNADGVFTAAEIGFLQELVIYLEENWSETYATPQQLALMQSCKAKLGALHPQ